MKREVFRDQGTEVWHERLVTAVNQFIYDFDERIGVIRLPAGCCTDMSGAIRCFERIDPDVRQVQVFAGDELDTIYTKEPGGWICQLPAPGYVFEIDMAPKLITFTEAE